VKVNASDVQQLAGLGGVVVVTALVEAVKQMFPDMDKRRLPVAALGCSLIVNALAAGAVWLTAPPEGGLAMLVLTFILATILAWLGAMGLYSGGKTMLGK